MFAKILIFGSVLFAAAAFADLRDDVYARFPLAEGNYREVHGFDTVSQTDKCEEGPLQIFEKFGGLTYKLGANPIAIGVALKNGTLDDEDCVSAYRTRIVSNALTSYKTETCKNDPQPVQVETTLSLRPNGFSYKRVIHEGRHKLRDEICELRKD